jgi:hypothetical protein
MAAGGQWIPRMAASTQPFARFGVGWAGSYVMTRAFARQLPGGPTISIVADMLNRLDLVAAGELDLVWAYPTARVSGSSPDSGGRTAS